MASPYEPKPEHKFSFGLWTVGNMGGDPFGKPVRKALTPIEIVHLLKEVGAWNDEDDSLLGGTEIDAEELDLSSVIGGSSAAVA